MEGTLVFLMGFHSLSAITEGLIRGGKSPQTPAALIENGSLLNQRVLRADLETLAAKAKEQGFHTPAIIVVGEAAAFNLQPETVNPRGPLDGMTGNHMKAAAYAPMGDGNPRKLRYGYRRGDPRNGFP